MGLSVFNCSPPSFIEKVVAKMSRRSSNPNPRNFKIIWMRTVGVYVVVKVNYPGCTNYEGDKILVYKGMTEREIAELPELDPHFYERGKKQYPSPIARFSPSKEGEDLAWFFVNLMSGRFTVKDGEG